jgi:hypothetical protein
MSPLDELFKNLDGGEHIPGGCDRCNAYQTVETPEPGIHLLHVHHDDWCPFLRSIDAGSN